MAKNLSCWKTTLGGLLGAAVSAIVLYVESGGDLADWRQYAIPVAIAVVGALSPDPKPRRRKRKAGPKLP